MSEICKDKRKCIIVGILAFILTLMQVLGWQISMDYGSSVHQSAFFQNIGVLTVPQCILWGIIEWVVFFVLLSAAFAVADRCGKKIALTNHKKYIWIVFWGVLFAVWLVFLWGCYPGFFNYDMGNQMVQVMYEEVPYNAHHTLVHTLFGGGLITLGYRLRDVDLTLGMLMYNGVQMLMCSGCLAFSVGYILKRTGSKVAAALAFIFYAICPPVVMFAMSTTKDVLCYSFLVVALVQMLELYEDLAKGLKVSWKRWVIIGIWLSISALIRKNIIYAVVVFAVFSILTFKKEWKRQILLFASVVLVYFVVNHALESALNAIPGSVNEALCVPYQQIARLYNEVGPEAFTEEEYELLSTLLPPDALYYYDPVMGDYTKANFSVGIETLKANPWPYVGLWLKKGLEYPQIYLESILYNTYQAWYPGTQVLERRRIRYFDISDWQYQYGAPHWQGLFTFYEKIHHGEYIGWPVVRLLFATGTMFWGAIITWFYGMWRRDKGVILTYLFVILTCGTTFLGPVSDVRYYLQLFYLFPVGIAIMFSIKKDKGISEDELIEEGGTA